MGLRLRLAPAQGRDLVRRLPPETRAYYAKYARENFVNHRDADPSTSLSDLLRRAYAYSTWVLNKQLGDSHCAEYLDFVNGLNEFQSARSRVTRDSAIMGIVDIDNDKANPQVQPLCIGDIYKSVCYREQSRRSTDKDSGALEQEVTEYVLDENSVHLT
ncbi:LYR motif-containing protein [Ananas comosus]|uniref:LYR motif-containing protein n=1 Tax=Ananas comosus TaxID=4615 RepID=A0A199W438_ANACO|nr:LYR motif-containing protein [Ananas comosus]